MNPDAEDAALQLQRLFPWFTQTIELAWQEYQKTPNLHKFEASAKAQMFRDLIVYGFKDVNGVKDVRVYRKGQLFLIVVNGIYRIRVKKLDKHLRARNAPTKQALAFSSQICLFSSNELAPTVNLNLGCVVSADWQSINRIALVCPQGADIAWHIDLLNHSINASPSKEIAHTETKKQTPNARVKAGAQKKKAE